MSDLVNKEDTSNVSIPSGWVFAEFDETCKPVSDGGRKVSQKAYLKSGRYPIVDQGEALIGGFTNDASMLFHGETPVIAFGDHTRRFKLVDWPFVVGADGVKLIGLTSAWNPKCLWYFLRALKFEDRGYSRHFQFLRKARLPLPPLPEQSRIADALDELLSDLDAGVAALERIREKLKLYRASVLKAAVEGALTAEWRVQHPLTEPASELLNRILAERRRRWEEEQLAKFKAKGQEPPKNWKAKYKDPVALLPPTPAGEIPARWTWTTLSMVVDLINGDRGENYPSKSELVERGIPFINAGHIQRGRLAFNEMNYVTEERYQRLRSGKTTEGDVLYCLRGSLGKAAIVRDLEKGAIASSLVIIRPPALILSTYLHTYVMSPLGTQMIQFFDNGSAQPNLAADSVGKYRFPLPPIAEQEAIVDAVEDQLSIIDHLEADLDAKLESVQALRQAILRQAFTGQLVPQDPNDEPASELVKRIAAEREARARVSAGKPDGVRKRTRRASSDGRLLA